MLSSLVLAFALSDTFAGSTIADRTRECPEELRPVHTVAPAYPTSPQARTLEGWVKLEFEVGTDGTVSRPQIIESSSKHFEKVSLNAIEKWRYSARSKSCRHRMTLTFEVEA